MLGAGLVAGEDEGAGQRGLGALLHCKQVRLPARLPGGAGGSVYTVAAGWGVGVGGWGCCWEVEGVLRSVQPLGPASTFCASGKEQFVAPNQGQLFETSIWEWARAPQSPGFFFLYAVSQQQLRLSIT